jgi:hypothetical protein
MSSKIFVPGLLVAILFLSSCSAMRDPNRQIALWGDPAPPSAATRTIVIHPDTKYVNVEGGEVVKFIAGGQTFAWAFVPQGGVYFELNKIAPPGALDHRVMAAASTPDRYVPGW